MNERQHGEAWTAAITANLGTWQAYQYGDEPEVLPDIYVLISVARRYVRPARWNGVPSTSDARLSTLVVGTTRREAQWARQRVAEAIERKPVTIGGGTAYAVFETEQPIAEDDGRYSGATSWAYSVARTA